VRLAEHQKAPHSSILRTNVDNLTSSDKNRMGRNVTRGANCWSRSNLIAGQSKEKHQTSQKIIRSGNTRSTSNQNALTLHYHIMMAAPKIKHTPKKLLIIMQGSSFVWRDKKKRSHNWKHRPQGLKTSLIKVDSGRRMYLQGSSVAWKHVTQATHVLSTWFESNHHLKNGTVHKWLYRVREVSKKMRARYLEEVWIRYSTSQRQAIK
jgi:hypothetical protein